MGHDRVNPNRIPVREKDYDLERIKQQAINGKLLLEWAVILAAMSNLEEMSTEKLFEFWQRLNHTPAIIYTLDEVDRELAKIREQTGVPLFI